MSAQSPPLTPSFVASIAMTIQHLGNRLSNQTSPYLRQHAHNPVDWYPWGGEAIDRAREEDRPILLSVGYSACHWCHVMARGSFEDEDIASCSQPTAEVEGSLRLLGARVGA